MKFFGRRRKHRITQPVSNGPVCPKCSSPLEEITEGPYKGFFCEHCLSHFFRRVRKARRNDGSLPHQRKEAWMPKKEEKFFPKERKVWPYVVVGLLALAGLTPLGYYLYASIK